MDAGILARQPDALRLSWIHERREPRMHEEECVMKPARSVVAVLLAGAAMAVSAQSHLTLYGIIDLGYLYTDPANGPSMRELADGIQSQSRFGVRGVERLTRDLNAVFTLEGGLAVDTGQSQQANRLFGRQAWASLVAHAGEIRLGRQYGLGYEYFLADTSPFGTTFRDAGTGNVFSSASGRLILDNVVMARTGDFGGFSGAVGYSFNANGAEQPVMGNNTDAWTAGARYRGHDFYLAASYESFSCPDTASGTTFNACNAVSRQRQSHWQVGGSYAFSVFRIYGMWGVEENQFNFFAVTPAKKADVYELGVRAKFSGGEVFAAYQGRDDDWNADLDVWGLGYTYPLSRRTNLYTFVSNTSADDTPTAQVVSGGRIVSEGYTAAQISAYRERDRVQVGAGVRHTF
jgi:general bacterial porin, GBP family